MSPTTAPAAERVYAHVKRAILEHDYPGGDFITEGEVAAQVGVSRTPVREGLLRLEAEGLLRLYPKRGALVVPVTPREADEVHEARSLVESWAAPRAARAGQPLLDQLERHVAAMRRHAAAGQTREFAAADRAFHEAVVEAAGNSVLTRLYVSLRERQLCLSSASIAAEPGRAGSALADHEALLEALRSGDVDAFTRRTVEHVARSSPSDRDAS